MKRIIINLIGLSVVGCLLPGTAAAAAPNDTLAKIRETQTIVIAYREGSAPFSFLDESKQAAGYSVELCVKLADAVKKELGLATLKTQFIPVDSASRFTSIMEGKADLECGTTTNNVERRKKVAF